MHQQAGSRDTGNGAGLTGRGEVSRHALVIVLVDPAALVVPPEEQAGMLEQIVFEQQLGTSAPVLGEASSSADRSGSQPDQSGITSEFRNRR